ncbi:hypothetical protein L6R53_03480 [Myxococcota bacterium]|nr:hypothetical protein [Myxococcota bacterium]
MRAFVLLACLALALPAPAGAADPVAQAEVQRLSIELRDRVEEARWEAADAAYRRLAAVQEGQPSYADHWRGYLAAQALGDAIAQAARLAAAREIQATPEVDQAEATLMAWFGRVELRLHRRLDPRPELVMDAVPFEADQRRVLEAATTALAEQGRYEGLLPLGMYRLGEVPFEVLGEDEPVRVHVRR